jgi:hypothetical protein
VGKSAGPNRPGPPASTWQPHVGRPTDQIQTCLPVMESGLVCFRDLAFFNFLLPLVDAMVFPLPFGLPLWAVGPIYANPGPNVQSNESITHLV